jgi:hypothetical protein
VLVPGPPVRIHARIGGHRNGSRGKEGTRKRSAGRTRGGIKGGERERERRRGGEGEEKEKEPGKGKRGRIGREERNPTARRGNHRRDPSRGILYLSLCFPSASFYRLALPSFLPFCGTPYRLSSQPLSLFRPYNYSPSRSGEIFFMIKKSVTCLSGYTAPHSCAVCTGNSNTTSFPVNRR